MLAGGAGLHVLRRWRGVRAPGTPSPAQFKTVAAVLVADLLASLVNPRGIEILTLPLQQVASPWFTQEINELQRPLAHPSNSTLGPMCWRPCSCSRSASRGGASLWLRRCS
jgi:hypothetical protein